MFPPNKDAEQICKAVQQHLEKKLRADAQLLVFYDVEEQAISLDMVLECIKERQFEELKGLEDGVLTLQVEVVKVKGNEVPMHVANLSCLI
jgi:hypothetical protein